MKTKISSYLFLVIAVALAWYLFSRIKFAIDEEARIAQSEALVIEKLMLIREAEITFQEVHGRYTNNWDTLLSFINAGQYPIIERSEEIIPQAYGGDSIIVHIDTVDVIAAKKQIFEQDHLVMAADDGVFQEFFVKPGQVITKGQRIYSMISSITGKKGNQVAKQSGKITKLENVSMGQQLVKGDLLFMLVEEKFNPATDIASLPMIPSTDKKFELFADKIVNNNIKVNVIEVRDIAPTDPTRNEDNEANNRKPLRFGSRTEVTTVGNWE